MTKPKRNRPNATGRTKLPASERYVKLPHYLLQSPAYRSLTPNARSLYVELKLLYNGSNNGDIFMSWRTAAAAVGVRTPATAAKALKELAAKGFIQCRVQGSFDNKINLATQWILTEHENRGRPATKEFMRWRPDTPKEKSRMEKCVPPYLKKQPAESKNDTVVGENGLEYSLRSLPLGGGRVVD